MKRSKENGFTLVELLAVIVILAIILVIAVPKVMSIIEDAKMGTLESTAKMIASGAEKQKVQNTVLGNNKEITCDSVAKINKGDYANCSIEFVDNTAKVTIEGSGKFEGLWVCDGTKTNAEAKDEECDTSDENEVKEPVSFEIDNWATIVAAVQSGNYPYEVGEEKLINLGDDLGVHTIRIANTSSCEGLSLSSETACGFVLEFVDIITTQIENEYDFLWSYSNSRTYVNETIYNSLPSILREAIIDTKVVSFFKTYSFDDFLTEFSYNETNDKIYMLSPEEIFGSSFLYYSAVSTVSRQLDYYKLNNVTTSNANYATKTYNEEQSSWVLRASFDENHVGGGAGLYNISSTGTSSNLILSSDNSVGVSPAFRIA